MEQRFIKACELGKNDAVRDFICRKVNLDAVDGNGCTAVIRAAYNGKTEIVQMLIAAGCDFNIQDKNGCTALIRATYNGKTGCVQQLIAAGCDLNVKDEDGDTAIIKAADKGKSEIVQLLIAAKCEFNIQGRAGNTALIRAVYYGNSKIVQHLIDAKCDFNVKDENGCTAVIRAAYNGKTEIVQMLIAAGCDFNIQDKDGNTVLIVAAYYGDSKIVQLLIAVECDFNIQNKDNKTAKDVAAERGHFEIVKMFEEAKLISEKRGPIQDIKTLTATENDDIDLETQNEIDLMCGFLKDKVGFTSKSAKSVAKKIVLEVEISSPQTLENLYYRNRLDDLLKKLKVSDISAENLRNYFCLLKENGLKSLTTSLSNDNPSTIPSVRLRVLLDKEIIRTKHSLVLNGSYKHESGVGKAVDVEVKVKILSTKHIKLIEKEFQYLYSLHVDFPGMFVRPFALLKHHEFEVISTDTADYETKSVFRSDQSNSKSIGAEQKMALVLEKGFETLQQRMNTFGNNSLHFKDKEFITERLLRIIDAAHKNGLVYMDLKPCNIMRFVGLRGDVGTWKGIDLGGALPMNADLTHHEFMGTVEFMPPELCVMDRAGLKASPSIDVWALGVIVLKMFLKENINFWNILGFKDAKEDTLPRLPSSAKLQIMIDSLIESRFHGEKFSSLRHFLKAVLKANPFERPSADDLFGKSFITGAFSFSSSVLYKSQQELLKGQQEIKTTLSAHTALLRDMLEGQNYVPNLFILYPKEPKKTWKWNPMRLFQDRWNPMRLFKDTLILKFLCPVTLKVPDEAEGYELTFSKKWLVQVAPLLYVGLMVVSLAVRMGTGIPLPIPPEVLEGLGAEPSTILQDYADTLSELVMKEANATTFQQVKEAVDGQSRVSDHKLLSAAYTEIRSMLVKAEGFSEATVPHDWSPDMKRTGLERLVCETAGMSSGVAFVSQEGKDQYLKYGKRAFK